MRVPDDPIDMIVGEAVNGGIDADGQPLGVDASARTRQQDGKPQQRT